jgi:hypothetical protein
VMIRQEAIVAYFIIQPQVFLGINNTSKWVITFGLWLPPQRHAARTYTGGPMTSGVWKEAYIWNGGGKRRRAESPSIYPPLLSHTLFTPIGVEASSI